MFNKFKFDPSLMQSRFIDKTQLKNGFSLVEVTITVVILSVAAVSTFAVILSSLNSSFFSNNNLIAMNLSQEGLELVRNIRDNNWLAGLAFNTNLADGNYVADYETAALAAFVDTPLLFDSGRGHQYTQGQSSIFKRKIIITAISTTELKIESEVTWQTKNINRTIKIESRLWDWK